MNLSKLGTDLGAEVTDATTFITGVEKLVNDAKAAGLTSVTIADLEALVPEAEVAIKDGENIVTDL